MAVDHRLLVDSDETDIQKHIRFIQLELSELHREKEKLVKKLLRVNQDINEYELMLQFCKSLLNE
ncbi:hypothetical protein QO009_003106 [Brevibacillus aydinogluensis]|jgi:hypothetical protein|uniref:hypothetical protein n=1 Tax=Brevibacillus aydinogluensis TaxID=927786 RepID=UPI002893824A|nr:hypothetical protein [Brevibacillus aydinogluensis]MDT3417211.1 hypothetical protein [Brevibacillus aydinogluensis]